MFNTSNKLHLWIGLSALILSLSVALTIITVIKFLPPRLPLFYSLPWGEEQLAIQQEFLIIPGAIVLVTLLNFAVSSQLHSSQKFFKDILYITSLSVTVILLITFIKVGLMFA